MKIYDVTKVISEEMTVYKNRDSKKIQRFEIATYPENDMYESDIRLNMHTGTHMDAPLHMINGGKSVEQVDVATYIGKAKVFDLTHVKVAIYEKDIRDLDIEEGDRVIFKTRNSFDPPGYNPNFIYLEEDGAAYLRDKKIRLIGIDAMSLERDKPEHPTHKIILGAEIGVVEDMDLSKIEAGEYTLHALPLLIKGAEATPVRALLIQD